MIQNIQTPSLEDLIDAFRSREKEQLDTAAATKQAHQDFWAAYELSKEPELRKLHELVSRVFATFIERGQLLLGHVTRDEHRGHKENWLFLVAGNIAPTNGYQAATVWRPNSTHPEPALTGPWRWSLPDIQIVSGLKPLGYACYKDWDEMTLILCEYAGKCLARLDA